MFFDVNSLMEIFDKNIQKLKSWNFFLPIRTVCCKNKINKKQTNKKSEVRKHCNVLYQRIMPVIKVLLRSNIRSSDYVAFCYTYLFGIMNHWICLWWLSLSTAPDEYKTTFKHKLLETIFFFLFFLNADIQTLQLLEGKRILKFNYDNDALDFVRKF